MEPAKHLWWLAAVAVLVAFCSASQDIVFDAYKTDLLTTEERGTGGGSIGTRLPPGNAGFRWVSVVDCRSLSWLAINLLANGRIDVDWGIRYLARP